MTSEQIHEALTANPSEQGTIASALGDPVPYRIELLPPGVLNELRIERNNYLRERGIDECTAATAEIYEAELQFRVLAAAVHSADGDQPLAPVEGWRQHIGSAVRTCLDHYTKLEALSDDIDMSMASALPELSAYVRKVQGPGQVGYWQTVDYETLLACFAKLSLEHDQAERELQELRGQV